MEEDRVNNMLPPALMKSRNIFGVRFGPRPTKLAHAQICKCQATLPFDFEGRIRTWSNARSPSSNKPSFSFFGDSKVFLKPRPIIT